MGHYLACRYYRVERHAALLPADAAARPDGHLRRGDQDPSADPVQAPLFDIGIAGPIAGFLVAVPALSRPVRCRTSLPVPPNIAGLNRWASRCCSRPPHGWSGARCRRPFDINCTRWLFAAWFGLLVTALNLFPIAQLDGGHICLCRVRPARHVHHVRGAGRRRSRCLAYSTSWLVLDRASSSRCS